jgi:hypothetical protein
MKRIGIASLMLLAAGCATGEKREEDVAPEPGPSRIDYLAVQHDLGMGVSPDWTGYQEKRFDACRMAKDLPDVRDCSRAYFVQVGVQLSCRPPEDGQGAILERSDLTPVGNRELTWKLGEASGRMRTDWSGVGLIHAITSGSMKKTNLRISTGEDFLQMRAAQATQIVTPESWCK